MRWTPGGDDQDIEDRRDQSGDPGGGGGFGFGGLHLGIGGFIILLLLSFVFRQNLFSRFSGARPAPVGLGHPSGSASSSPAAQREADLAKFVLHDVQATWDRQLPLLEHVPYRHATLVLYRNLTRSACGRAESATGPFYCPDDEKVYLDLAFFDKLKSRFGGPGDFAEAYVIAHEIGHHLQKILGIESKVQRLEQSRPEERNPLSVRLELQADCFAGVWANSTAQRDIIDRNDVEAGLRAAAAVGDDRLQKMATGHVSPESFTHGSSAGRMRWFKAGLQAGRLSACNTFQH